jgi:hypothetical protein
MAKFQVVAVGQRTGLRSPVLKPHDSWIGAEWHRALCAATYPEEVYEIDGAYGNGDAIPWTQNVDGVTDLGYPAEEVAEIRTWALENVARRNATLERTP